MANFRQELKELVPINGIDRLNVVFSLLNRRHTVISPHIDKAIFKYVIDNLHRLMVCGLTGHHLHHPTGKVVLPTNRTTCVVSTPHLRMTWMTMA